MKKRKISVYHNDPSFDYDIVIDLSNAVKKSEENNTHAIATRVMHNMVENGTYKILSNGTQLYCPSFHIRHAEISKEYEE